MGKTGVLGSFEELILLAILQNAADAYAVTIRRELEERSSAEVVMGAVYATLDRLEDKGLVGSTLERRSGVAGRPRRYYSVLPAGFSVLADTRAIRDAMWSGLNIVPPQGLGS